MTNRWEDQVAMLEDRPLPRGLEGAVRDFRSYAESVGPEAVQRERVALIAWTPDRHLLLPLANEATRRDGFYVPWGSLESAIRRAGDWGARRVILAHTHRGGRAVPSSAFPHGDVQNLGAPAWVARLDALLQSLAIAPPMLHLICVVPAGWSRLFIIDRRLGAWRRRLWRGRPALVRLGWREVMDMNALD